jgi:hypothetical protein
VKVPNLVLPLLTSVASFALAALVLDQWRQRRRSFQLVWGLGLLSYGISSGAQFVGAFGWTPVLYRLWYMFGALLVAAYLGTGTVYLLSRTGFGYFAAFSVFVGGLFAPLSQLRLIQQGHPTSWTNVWLVVGASALAGVVIGYATARHRRQAAHVTMAVLAAASVLAAVLVATASLGAPGYALDPLTRVPVGDAMPGYLRVMTGPYNIAGGFCLVFGAIFSVYVYMPKRKLLRGRVATPVLGQLYLALAVTVNLLVSLPVAVAALLTGRLNSRVPATVLIALGGFVPGITSGLDRFGVTWSFYLGQLLGVLFILTGFLVSEEVFANLRLRSVGARLASPFRRRASPEGPSFDSEVDP